MMLSLLTTPFAAGLANRVIGAAFFAIDSSLGRRVFVVEVAVAVAVTGDLEATTVDRVVTEGRLDCLAWICEGGRFGRDGDRIFFVPSAVATVGVAETVVVEVALERRTAGSVDLTLLRALLPTVPSLPPNCWERRSGSSVNTEAVGPPGIHMSVSGSILVCELLR